MSFLWHFPAGFPGSDLPTTLPCDVRTFLEGLALRDCLACNLTRYSPRQWDDPAARRISEDPPGRRCASAISRRRWMPRSTRLRRGAFSSMRRAMSTALSGLSFSGVDSSATSPTKLLLRPHGTELLGDLPQCDPVAVDFVLQRSQHSHGLARPLGLLGDAARR